MDSSRSNEILLKVSDLKKGFAISSNEFRQVIDIPHLEINIGERIYLSGQSGSGKTTLIHLLAGILRADSGSVLIQGQDIQLLSESRRDRFRGEHIGLLFQTFQLLPGLSALENVALPAGLVGRKDGLERARELLSQLDMGERIDDTPDRLSVGQCQRVALARSLINRPPLLLADEPTASLDKNHGAEALSLILETCAGEGAALLMVSHDESLQRGFDRVLNLKTIGRTPEEDEG